jgi:hypothetical protein
MNLLTEAMNGLGAAVLPVVAALLLEELTYGGLVRLLVAPWPGSGRRGERGDRSSSLGCKRGERGDGSSSLGCKRGERGDAQRTTTLSLRRKLRRRIEANKFNKLDKLNKLNEQKGEGQ